MPGLDLWNSVCETDPKYTRSATDGRHKFTDIAPYWLIKQATAKWGPMGHKWGYRITNRWQIMDVQLEKNKQGALLIELELYYPNPGGEEGTVTVFGMSKLDANGVKIAVTDALTKAMSYIGFAGDVFLGQFEQAAHRQAMAEKFGAGKPAEEPADSPKTIEERFATATRVIRAAQSIARLKELEQAVEARDFTDEQKAKLLQEVANRRQALTPPPE